MANVFTYIKEASLRHKIVKLHKLCCKGTAQKPVRGFKNVPWETWVELMGYYRACTGYQEIKPALSRQARNVLSRIGL